MIEEKDVLAADQIRRDAMVNADVDALSQVFDDDMLWVHATGKLDTKPGFIEFVSSGKIKYMSIETTDEVVRVVGDIALINGIAHIKAEAGGAVREIENRYTIVWRLVAGELRVLNWQSTNLSAAIV